MVEDYVCIRDNIIALRISNHIVRDIKCLKSVYVRFVRASFLKASLVWNILCILDVKVRYYRQIRLCFRGLRFASLHFSETVELIHPRFHIHYIALPRLLSALHLSVDLLLSEHHCCANC